MNMTTPRVTVPVEPTVRMLSAGAAHMRDDALCTPNSVWSAMLSAAPVREEGGAVSEGELRDAITLILPMAKGYAAAHPVGSNQSYVDYVEGLIANREEAAWSQEFDGENRSMSIPEAPAEAAEDDGLFLLMKRGLYYRPNAMGYTGIKDHAGRYTKAEAEDHADALSGVTAIAAIDAPDFSPACFDDLARAHLAGKLEQATRELSALRAQPSAREDAQPVAWFNPQELRIFLGNANSAGRAINLRRAQDDYATDALYTHPAPDALRAAVEALEAAGRAISAQYALAQAEYQHLDHLATKHDKIVQEGRRAIREALDALQAEQKGGS